MKAREQEKTLRALQRCGRRLRQAALLRSGATALAVGSALFMVAVLLPPDWMHGAGSPVPMTVLALAALLLMAAGFRTGKQVRQLRHDRLNPEIEAAAGLRDGELRGAEELARVRAGQSASLAAAQRRRVISAVAGRTPRQLLPFSWPSTMRGVRNGGVAFGVAVLSMGAVVGTQPTRAGRTAQALAAPWRVAFPPPPPPLVVRPGDAEVERGTALHVRVSAPQRSAVTLVWQAIGEVQHSIAIPIDSRTFEANALTGPIESETRYWVRDGDGIESGKFRIRPIDPLLVTRLEVEAVYPAYSARGAERWSRPLPQLTIPAGTRLRISGGVNHRLAEAHLLDDRGVRHEFVVAERSFRMEMTPRSSMKLSWVLHPLASVPGVRSPEPLSLTVLTDLIPQVAITFPAADTTLGPRRSLPLVIDARDDHGLRRIELVSWRVSASGTRGEASTALVGEPGGSRTRVVARPLLDLADRGLLPGDTVVYYARARDENVANPAGVSDTFRVRVPTLVEIRRQAARSADDLVSESRRLRAAAQDLERQAREAERGLARTGLVADGEPAREGAEPRSSFESTEDGRRVLEQAQTLRRGLESLEQEIGSLQDGLSDSGLTDPKLKERLRELEELYEEILQSGLGEKIQQLQQALRDLDPEQLQRALKRLSSEMRSLQRQIEQSVALMERVAIEQGLKSARSRTEDLARQQRSLAARDPVSERWADTEERLAAETAAVEAELQRLAERLDAATTSEANQATRDAGDRLTEAAAEMREAAESAQAARAQESERDNGSAEQASTASQVSRAAASRKAQEAQSTLSRAAEGLRSAGESLTEDWREEVLKVIGRAAREALDLAREQVDLLGGLSAEASTVPPQVKGREAAVRQGLANLVQSLAEAGRKTALLDRRTGPIAARAAEQMDILLADEDGDAVPRRELSQQIAEALNDLAGRLMASRRAVEGSQSATGMDEALEMLSQMSQAQGGLNQESNSLMLLGQTGQQMASRLQQLAARQQSIGEQLDELAGNGGKLDELGRLEELADEARGVAGRLQAGALDRETLERQERLFRRLLDAGQTLEKNDEDPDRRESRSARQGGRPDIEPVDSNLLTGTRFAYPSEADLRSVSPTYRRLVLDYFDRLNAPESEKTP